MPLRKPTDATVITANGVHYRTWTGGRGVITVSGGFDSGTVTLSVLNQTFTTKDTAADYTTMGTDVTFTAAGNGQFYLMDGRTIAAVVTGASGSATLDIQITEVD